MLTFATDPFLMDSILHTTNYKLKYITYDPKQYNLTIIPRVPIYYNRSVCIENVCIENYTLILTREYYKPNYN